MIGAFLLFFVSPSSWCPSTSHRNISDDHTNKKQNKNKKTIMDFLFIFQTFVNTTKGILKEMLLSGRLSARHHHQLSNYGFFYIFPLIFSCFPGQGWRDFSTPLHLGSSSGFSLFIFFPVYDAGHHQRWGGKCYFQYLNQISPRICQV